MNSALTNEILQRLGWVLTHTLWEFALIALVVAFARGWLRSAASRYIITSLGSALFLFVSAATLLLVMRQPLPHYSPLDASLRSLPAMQEFPAAAYVGPLASDSTVIVPATPVPVLTRARAAFESILPVLSALYFAGLIAFTLRLIVSYRHTRRLIAAARPASPNLHARVTDLARRVGVHRALRLLETAAVEVPCIVGGYRPVILVPASSLAQLAAAQLDALLAHELAHLRRWDDLANYLQCALETLFFYHPATWWLSGQIRQEREHCCDDIAAAVCGDRVLYVSALTTLEELRTMTRLMPAARGGQLLQRIRRLLDVQEVSTRRFPASLAIALAFAAITITAASLHIARAQTSTLSAPPATAPTSQPADGQPPLKFSVALKPENGGRILLTKDGKEDFGAADVVTLHLADGPDGLMLRSFDETALNATTAASQPAAPKTEEPVVYIMGPVRNPGCYSINAAKDLTAKKLIALTGMDMPDVTGIWVVLTHHGENGKDEIARYSLAAIFSGETPDPRLKPGDVLWLRKSNDLSRLEDQRTGLTAELNRAVSMYGVNQASVKDLRARLAALNNQIETGGTQPVPQDPAALDQIIRAGLESQIYSLQQRFGKNDPRVESFRLRLDSFNKEIAVRDRSGSVEAQLSRLNELLQALTRELDDARKAYGETHPVIGNLQSRIEEVEKEITSLGQKKAPLQNPSPR